MKSKIILLYVRVLRLFSTPLTWSSTTIRFLFIPGFNKFRRFNSQAKAYFEFEKAKKHTPAYQHFLSLKSFNRPNFKGLVPQMNEVPVIDKENYVKQYSLAQRCVDGQIPTKGIIIDESSGSSGSPTNWIRGKKERKLNERFIRFGVQYQFGKDPIFIINAFALGAWATGINVAMSCIGFSKIKSVGPDKQKIEHTIKNFGDKQKYIIMGYPPFLKMLVDDSSIDWNCYDVSFIFGGESMSEEMRDYLLAKGIRKVISSLGASDLELNISTESPFTIAVRRLLRNNEKFKTSIVQHAGALPMVFQYNSADFLMETNEQGELLVTICRPNYVAPKIRYNIHDRGHVVELKELYKKLEEAGINRSELPEPTTDLPMLFHYGRADLTVSFFGSNVNLVDVQEVIYKIPSLAKEIISFHVSTPEDGEGNKVLKVSFEVNNRELFTKENEHAIKEKFFNLLAEVNQDFREAKRMFCSATQTNVLFHRKGEGPFSDKDIRIKANYVS